MARIRIYIARHLCTAPRPQKEADALAAAGHEVSVHGVAFRADFSARDALIARDRAWQWKPVADFSTPGRQLAWFGARLGHRFARELYRFTGRVTADVWGYANASLAVHAMDHPADLTLVHAEGGLAFGHDMLQRGHRVGVDFEDWFSHDLTPDQQRGRPVAKLMELEHALLQRTPYATTTSRSLAKAMAREYGTPEPKVIYNTFPAGAEPDIHVDAQRPVSLHWFSQVIGPDRGLETVFTALSAVSVPWTFTLRGEGDPSYCASLMQRLPAGLHGRVRFEPTVPASELPAILSRHDIGFAVETAVGTNRNLTISNKLFHYLQAGLAVVASDTAGHREGLAQAAGAGIIFPSGDSPALANAINQLAADPSDLRKARHAARQAFVTHLAQEHQAPRYAELAAAALAR